MSEQKNESRTEITSGIVVNSRLRLISIVGWIDNDLLIQIQKHLMAFQQKAGAITCVVSSHCGGEVSAAAAIHDLLKSSPCVVTTVGGGDIFSAGLSIFLGGKRRILLPHSQIIFHCCIPPAYSPEYKRERNAARAHLKKQNDRVYAIIRENSILSKQQIKKFAEDSIIFSAEEAVRCGLAHKIVQTFPLRPSKPKRKK